MGGKGGTSLGAGADGIATNAGTAGNVEVAGTSTQGGSRGTSEGGNAGEGGGDDVAARCGDGLIAPSEQCDDGANNGPGKSCNAQCKENVCGDGDRGPTEGCDDGSENGLELLRCAPDCSRLIEMKHIVTATELPDEWLQPDPVAKADAQCPEGYKALFAYGSKRRATTSAFKSVNPVDWVLTPYTYYVNWTENLIWLTQEIALLGVEEGRFSGLVNPVAPYPLVYVSNLNVDGTTLVTDNCNGWSSTTNVFSKHYGVGFYSDESYLDAGVLECGYSVAFYCVEQ